MNRIECVKKWCSHKVATNERMKALVHSWEEVYSFLEYYFGTENLFFFDEQFEKDDFQREFIRDCANVFHFVFYRSKKSGMFFKCDLYLGTFFLDSYDILWDFWTEEEVKNGVNTSSSLSSEEKEELEYSSSSFEAAMNVLPRVVLDCWNWSGYEKEHNFRFFTYESVDCAFYNTQKDIAQILTSFEICE